jgi:hypothetical protein
VAHLQVYLIWLYLLIVLKQLVPAIPYTRDFIDARLNFVSQPLKMPIRYALLVGASEGGNYYAFVIKG